jgi:hypothetical protein
MEKDLVIVGRTFHHGALLPKRRTDRPSEQYALFCDLFPPSQAVFQDAPIRRIIATPISFLPDHTILSRLPLT